LIDQVVVNSIAIQFRDPWCVVGRDFDDDCLSAGQIAFFDELTGPQLASAMGGLEGFLKPMLEQVGEVERVKRPAEHPAESQHGDRPDHGSTLLLVRGKGAAAQHRVRFAQSYPGISCGGNGQGYAKGWEFDRGCQKQRARAGNPSRFSVPCQDRDRGRHRDELSTEPLIKAETGSDSV
jgi:hypothetical protein